MPNLFQRIIKDGPIQCDICQGNMNALYGGGWDNDRLLCDDYDCGAEVVFASSTLANYIVEGKL